MIRFIANGEERERIAAHVLHALPAWFGLPESTKAYIAAAKELPFWAELAEGGPRGFLALKQTGPRTAEIHVMGVLPQYHRQGIGTGLWQACRAYAQEAGYAFIQVKTVQKGRYAEYDQTNRFYEALGFTELECFPALWDPWNPCQVYICHIGGKSFPEAGEPPLQEPFWAAMEQLIQRSQIVIDRPKGTAHPRFPSFVYPVDYGYVKDTASMDGGGIDVWLGTAKERTLGAVVCTVDLMKGDSEIKLLIGCTHEETDLIYRTHNASQYMKGLLIYRK